MTFPTLVPSNRQFGTGNWPVTSYLAADGAEVRIRRGNRRTGSTLQLVYSGLSDTEVDLFLNHFNDRQGTFLSFSLTSGATKGYAGQNLKADTDNQWRYSGPVQVTSIYPGVSNVTVNLISVLVPV